MTAPPSDDQRLRDAFGHLEPSTDTRVRLEEHILADCAADRRSLANEWLDLFSVGPVLQAGYAVAATAGLAIITPVGSLILLATLL